MCYLNKDGNASVVILNLKSPKFTKISTHLGIEHFTECNSQLDIFTCLKLWLET